MKTEEKIVGEKIYLRKILETDVNEKYLGWLNDPQVNQYLETRWSEQTLSSILDFVQSKIDNKNEPLFAICTLESNEHIGNIKLGPINPYHKYADVSLFIGDKNYWGKGFATEAIKLITDYGFKSLKLNKICASAYEENIGSINAFKKCGYLQEGLLNKKYISNGKYTNTVVLGIIAEDFWGNK